MAIGSQGSKIEYDGEEIGELVSISGPSGSAPVIDVSHLQSDAAEKLLGLMDEGQIVLECNYVAADTGQVKCREHRAARTAADLDIFLADAVSASLECSAFCSGFSLSGGVNAPVRVSITLEINGVVTYN